MSEPYDPETRPVDSPPVRATTVRLDEAMMQAVQREAELQETNVSEFVRQAIAFRLGWLSALRTVSEGASPDSLLAHDALAKALARVAQR